MLADKLVDVGVNVVPVVRGVPPGILDGLVSQATVTTPPLPLTPTGKDASPEMGARCTITLGGQGVPHTTPKVQPT